MCIFLVVAVVVVSGGGGVDVIIAISKIPPIIKPGRCTSLRLILKAVYQNRLFIEVIGPSVAAVWS